MKLRPEQQAEIDEFFAAWKAEHSEVDQAIAEQQMIELPRYQVQVRLVDDTSVP